jgi:hypothetical protein
MEHKIGSEPERTRPFYPNDNPSPLADVDWKTRYNELKNRKDWDDEKDFVGLKRLGDRYHPLDPFFKFEGVPKGNETFDRIWWPFCGGAGGLAIGATSTWFARRPFWSSVLPTAAVTLIGMGLGLYSGHNTRRRARERDAVLIHYMLLHEKEFPLIGRHSLHSYLSMSSIVSNDVMFDVWLIY